MPEPKYWRYAVSWIDPQAVCSLRMQYTATIEEAQELAAEQIRAALQEVRILGVLWEKGFSNEN